MDRETTTSSSSSSVEQEIPSASCLDSPSCVRAENNNDVDNDDDDDEHESTMRFVDVDAWMGRREAEEDHIPYPDVVPSALARLLCFVSSSGSDRNAFLGVGLPSLPAGAPFRPSTTGGASSSSVRDL